MHHRVGTTLAWSVLPAPIPAPLARKAQRLAGFYATRLAVEGLLAVELFVLADGRLVVNELVPCPHPAFDATDAACATDQYEQLVRAVCALELGAVDLVVPAASVPLRAGAVAGLLAGRGPMEGERGAHAGDDASDTPLPPPLALPGTRVTWHRDRAACDPAARPEEVVGHLTATGETPEEAVARAQHAATVLRCTAHATAEDPPAVTTSPWRRPAVAGRGAVVPGFPWRHRFAVRP
jgi:5-(carboxyamino)imidazole ribonucleotide synthase